MTKADLSNVESSGTGTVIEPLLALERDDRTGVLQFSARGVATRVYVRAGEVVFADGGPLGETLGRMLIRIGRLTEEQVAAIIRRLTDAQVDHEHVRFGEIAVAYGFVTHDELDTALTQQVKEKIIGCIHRGWGDWTFAKDDPRVNEVGSYVVRTRPTLVEAAAAFPERRLETILHLDEDRYPEIVAPESVLIEEFELSKAERATLKDLDGTKSLHFILSKESSVTVAPLVAALVLGGGVTLRTTPTSMPPESRPIPPEFRTARRARLSDDTTGAHRLVASTDAIDRHHFGVTADLTEAVLPVGRESRHSSPTITVTKQTAPGRSSRSRLAPPGSEELARARDALGRLKLDLDARKPLNKRRRWPEPKNDVERCLMAESSFYQGRMHLRAEEAERALPGLHRALELRAEELEYELYVKWAQMLVNDAFQDDARRSELQSLAAALVRVDRDCALGLSILGHCTLHDGKEEAALRFFRRAAELDPKLADAGRLTDFLTANAANKERKPGSSTLDTATRRRQRGLLTTTLDEIVPMPVHKASNDAAGRTEHQAVEPADAPWEGAVPAASISEPPPRSSLPPPPPADLKPPPTPMRAPSLRPKVQGYMPATAGVSSSQPPMPPPSTPKPVVALPSVIIAEEAFAPPPNVASPHAPPTVDTPRFAIAAAPPASGATHGRIVAIAFAWIASLAVTAIGFYFVGVHENGTTLSSAASASSVTTVSSMASASSTTESSVVSTSSSAAFDTTAPASVASTADGASAQAKIGSPASSASSATSVIASSGKPPTTGVLRTPRAHKHRIYVDGHVVGEGGRNLTVPCGTRRVKVGSAGVERSIAIPCGGTIGLD